MFASSMAGGVCNGVPDVCQVPAPPAPPIPTPFPNMGQCAVALQASMKVLIQKMPTLNTGSQIPMSNGDEAGVAGGVVSGMIMGPVTFKLGSTKVMVEGKPCVKLGSLTAHNGTNANTVGSQIAPSQTLVLLKG